LRELPSRRRVDRGEQAVEARVAQVLGPPVGDQPSAHRVGVEHFHPPRDAPEHPLGDGGGVVVDEQVGPEGSDLPRGGLRGDDPHVEVGAVAVDRERYCLAVHPRGEGHQYAHTALLRGKAGRRFSLEVAKGGRAPGLSMGKS
jgi:hypothetical protein